MFFRLGRTYLWIKSLTTWTPVKMKKKCAATFKFRSGAQIRFFKRWFFTVSFSSAHQNYFFFNRCEKSTGIFLTSKSRARRHSHLLSYHRIITFLLNVLMYKSGAPLNIFVLKIQNQGKVNFHILRRGAKFQLPIINWI